MECCPNCGHRFKRARNLLTAEELEVIERTYPIGGMKDVMRELPHRSEGAVYDALRRLGVPLRQVEWTQEEVEIVEHRYPDGGTDAVRELLPHRSTTAIHTFVSRRGIKRKRRERC